MKQIIYVDVLVIINIYINYALLLLTCFFRKFNPDRLRLLLSSLFAGVYSLIIVIPDISDFCVSLSRVPALIFMVYLAFGFKGKKVFLKLALTFLGVNFLFAGVMFALWYLFSPEGMYFNGGVVYFGIDTLTLVLLTVLSYGVIKIIGIFTGRKETAGLIYSLEIQLNGKTYHCHGLYDTGNSLTDPFTAEGVIIVSIDVFGDDIGKSIFDLDDYECQLRRKLIPVKSLGGTGLLPCIRTDEIHIKGTERDFILKRPLVALTKEKIHAGKYGAILSPVIFDNAENIKGDSYALFS